MAHSGGRVLSYDGVGATRPAADTWAPGPRRFEQSIRIGRGDECWRACRAALLEWGVKTRSGFAVQAVDGGSAVVRDGSDYQLTARWGPFAIHEPVRVVAVVDEPDRCGFAYGTLLGHPVAGEEAFVVRRHSDESVWLTLRSLTLPAPGWRRGAFPILLLAQRYFRRRYLRALSC